MLQSQLMLSQQLCCVANQLILLYNFNIQYVYCMYVYCTYIYIINSINIVDVQKIRLSHILYVSLERVIFQLWERLEMQFF